MYIHTYIYIYRYIEHRVREVTSGERFSVTLFSPSHLDKLRERDWMNLESHGFPVHLYPERARAGQLAQSPEEATDVFKDAIGETKAAHPAKQLMVIVWCLREVRLIWALGVENRDDPHVVAGLQVAMDDLTSLTGG